MSAKWADFTFPPLNLLNIPKHQVLLDFISNYYYENMFDLWDQQADRDILKEWIESGKIQINVQGVFK